MIEKEAKIETSEGLMGTFICHPEEGGPHPVVFFYMDAPGKREELHDMARRIATTGYYVVLPNLYYRTTDHFELDFATGDNTDEMFRLMSGIGNKMVVRDSEAMIEFVETEQNADEQKIGCIGYCCFKSCTFCYYCCTICSCCAWYSYVTLVFSDDHPIC